MTGKVIIIGAGPGAADLLTVKAARLLGAAQVVLHDDLVPAEVLQLAPASAQIINVGKRCGRHENSQEKINALMVWHAGNGSAVVRLKSGDPAVFGRLGEELEALRVAGVEFEIVPGVTAASAAAAAAHITLTDRRTASSLTLLTAHNCRGEKLGCGGGDPRRTTLAVYMPGPNYGSTAGDLMECGVDANTPCVLVSNAGRKNEQRCFMRLADLPFALGVTSPAILVVGEVAKRTPAETGKDLDHVLGPILAPPDESSPAAPSHVAAHP
ncbi:MAG TPA: uroporphyrinogen-III C-methyltransferase [Candidatus Angelobacter sp.]